MARQRSDPRRAARHTGDVWQRGYEYRTERDFIVPFGPFEGVAHQAPAGFETDFLRTLDSGIIRGGILQSAWEAPVTANFSARTYTFYPRYFHLDGDDHLIIPGRLSSGNLVIADYDGTLNLTEYDTGLSVNNGGPMDFTAIGNDIYFVHGTGEVSSYDISAGSDATVTGSPTAGRFIFELDNNLCVIYKASDIWTVAWSVDGDPSDWSSIGSGSAVITNKIGDVLWHVDLLDSHLIIGEHGAVRMIPTGTLPPFRFVHEKSFPGIFQTHAAASYGNSVFFLGRDATPAVWINGAVRPLGSGPFNLAGENLVVVCVAPMLNAVSFGGDWGTAAYRTVFFSLFAPHQAVAEYNSASNPLIGVGPHGDIEKGLFFVEISGSLATTNGVRVDNIRPTQVGAAPTFETHRIHLGHRVHVRKLELLWSDGAELTTTVPQPTISFDYDENGTEYNVTPTLRGTPSATRSIYDLSATCDNFSLAFSAGTWTHPIGLRQIRVYCSVTSKDDLEVLSV